MVLLNKKMEQLIALKKVNVPERDYIFDSFKIYLNLGL